MKVTRQSEYYSVTQQAVDHSIKANDNYKAASEFNMPHLLSAPGIGRIGEDPRSAQE